MPLCNTSQVRKFNQVRNYCGEKIDFFCSHSLVENVKENLCVNSGCIKGVSKQNLIVV